MKGRVVAVASSTAHLFSKDVCASIRLVAGEGVAGDAHRGVTVKHRSRVARDPTVPNLRRVHLIHAELFDELQGPRLRDRPRQLDDFRPGLMQAVLDRDAGGALVRKAGIMAVAREGGEVRTGNAIRALAPDGAFRALAPV